MKRSICCPVIFTVILLYGVSDSAIAQRNASVKGNGKIITRSFSIDEFSAIILDGMANVEYTQAPGKSAVEVETDENMMEFMEIYTNKETLVLSLKDQNSNKWINIKPTKLNIRCQSPSLLTVTKQGSGTFRLVNELKGSKFNLTQQGSGSFIIHKKLEVNDIRFVMEGSGNLRAQESIAGEKMTLAKNGSGSSHFSGEMNIQEITITNSGSGNITMEGTITGRKMAVSKNGSGNFVCVNKIRNENMTISQSGGGNTRLGNGITTRTFKSVQSGGGNFTVEGNVNATQITVTKSGSGNYLIGGFMESGSIHILQEGSGNCSLKGRFGEGEIVVSGSGNVMALDATFIKLKCLINGSGSITATVTEWLAGTVSGSGKVSYKGNPQIENPALFQKKLVKIG